MYVYLSDSPVTEDTGALVHHHLIWFLHPVKSQLRFPFELLHVQDGVTYERVDDVTGVHINDKHCVGEEREREENKSKEKHDAKR